MIFHLQWLLLKQYTGGGRWCNGSRGGDVLCHLPLSFLPIPCDFCLGLLFHLSLHLTLGSSASLGCRATAEPLSACLVATVSYPQTVLQCGIMLSSCFMHSVPTYDLAFRTRTSPFIIFLFHKLSTLASLDITQNIGSNMDIKVFMIRS